MANLDFKLRHRHATSKAGERIHILLHYRDDLAGLVDLGLQVSSVAGDVAAGSIPFASLEQFRDHAQVVYIEASRSMKDEMDVSAVAINLVDPSTGRKNVPGWRNQNEEDLRISVDHQEQEGPENTSDGPD